MNTLRALPSARGWAVLLLMALLAGPGATPALAANREHQQMLAELRMLHEQNQQLTVAVAALAEALRTVQQRLEDESVATRKVAADHRVAMEALGGDLRIVREKLDDTNLRLSRLSQELEAMREALPVAGVPPVASPAESPASSTMPPTGPGPSAPTPVTPSVAGLSPQRLYDTAYADFASGQWAMAVAGFETFIKSFPRSEQADQAQYYIGESYLLEGRFQEAVAAYDRVIANYPTGDQVPLAYYKRGIALLQLKQPDRARESWETVIQRFPDSDASRLARQGLDRLARTGR